MRAAFQAVANHLSSKAGHPRARLYNKLRLFAQIFPINGPQVAAELRAEPGEWTQDFTQDCPHECVEL